MLWSALPKDSRYVKIYQPWEGSPALPVRVVDKSSDPSGRDQFQKDFHPDLKILVLAWHKMVPKLPLKALKRPMIYLSQSRNVFQFNGIDFVKQHLFSTKHLPLEGCLSESVVFPCGAVFIVKEPCFQYIIDNCVFFIEGIFLAKARLEGSSRLEDVFCRLCEIEH